MFKKQEFTSHSGIKLQWKIECDDLTDDDIETLAYIISRQITFNSVYGIPNGGTRLANTLQKYCLPGNDKLPTHGRLLVDDVLTTGKSMIENYQAGDVGVVIFDRSNDCPLWVFPIFRVGVGFD